MLVYKGWAPNSGVECHLHTCNEIQNQGVRKHSGDG